MSGSEKHTGVFKFSPTTTSVFIALSIAAILLTSISGFWLIIRQNPVHEASANVPKAFLRLERAIGYAGFIHNFKNYILRPDERDSYLKAAKADYSEALNALHELDLIVRAVAIDDHVTTMHIRSTLAAYRNMLDRAEQIRGSGDEISIEALDEIVRVPDDEAAEELIHLQRHIDEFLSADYQRYTKQQLYMAIIDVIIMLVAITTAIWGFRQRHRQQERARKDAKQTLLINELNHRVRNILALACSIAQLTSKTETTVEDYAKEFEARMRALAVAHDLGAGGGSEAISIRKLIELELSPYASEDPGRFVIRGNGVQIEAERAPIFALVIHELATNAVKYGALSMSSGKINVRLDRSNEGLDVTWVEQDGPVVNEPTRTGLGSSLIQNAVPFELGGRADIEYDRAGFRAKLFLPNKVLVDDPGSSHAHDEKPKATKSSDVGNSTQAEEHVLLVEDNFMIAAEMRDYLESFGFRKISLFSNLRDAMEFLNTELPTIAVLDVNLGPKETTAPIAAKLQAHDVPFIFVSGYGEDSVVLKAFEGATRLQKPVIKPVLEAELNGVLSGRRQQVA